MKRWEREYGGIIINNNNSELSKEERDSAKKIVSGVVKVCLSLQAVHIVNLVLLSHVKPLAMLDRVSYVLVRKFQLQTAIRVLVIELFRIALRRLRSLNQTNV